MDYANAVAVSPATAELDRLALLELEEVSTELARRRRDLGMEFYVPNPMQLKAHASSAKTILYIGGNRAGKSTFGAMELCYHLTLQYPDWFSPKRRFRGPIKAVVVATEFPIIERVIEPKLMSYLPRALYEKSNGGHLRRTPQGYLSRLTLSNGSTVDFLTNEMDDMAFESADWDVYWGDEPQKKTKFFAIQRGLVDRQGMTLLTFTPLTEPWIKDELVDKADGKEIEVVSVDIRDNKFDIHGSPILSEEAIQRFESKLPDDLKQTRLHGQFFHLRGIVYTEFDPATHTWLESEKFPGYQYPDPVICLLDPHDRLPHHVIWAFVDHQDNLYVDRELVFTGTLKELGKQILLTEAKAGYRLTRRLVDPNFGRSPDQVGSGRTVIQELASKPFSVFFGEAADDKQMGHDIVKKYLHWDKTKPLSVTNMPKLYLHRARCPVTIRSLRNYQYQEWMGKTRDEKDPKEVEKPKDTHGADVVRYLCMSQPKYDRMMHRDRQMELVEALY